MRRRVSSFPSHSSNARTAENGVIIGSGKLIGETACQDSPTGYRVRRVLRRLSSAMLGVRKFEVWHSVITSGSLEAAAGGFCIIGQQMPGICDRIPSIVRADLDQWRETTYRRKSSESWWLGTPKIRRHNPPSRGLTFGPDRPGANPTPRPPLRPVATGSQRGLYGSTRKFTLLESVPPGVATCFPSGRGCAPWLAITAIEYGYARGWQSDHPPSARRPRHPSRPGCAEVPR